MDGVWALERAARACADRVVKVKLVDEGENVLSRRARARISVRAEILRSEKGDVTHSTARSAEVGLADVRGRCKGSSFAWGMAHSTLR